MDHAERDSELRLLPGGCGDIDKDHREVQRDMNPYLKHLTKIEFVITNACTGRCKHCSEGDHTSCGERIDPAIAAEAVRRIKENYRHLTLIESHDTTDVKIRRMIAFLIDWNIIFFVFLINNH